MKYLENAQTKTVSWPWRPIKNYTKLQNDIYKHDPADLDNQTDHPVPQQNKLKIEKNGIDRNSQQVDQPAYHETTMSQILNQH